MRLLRAGLLAAALSLLPLPAPADTPGDFDFYVLALSWSPSYCEAEGSARDGMQCNSGRPYAFVVHGLWPQRERGFPSDCAVRDEPSRREVDSVLDLMPSPGLVRYQWRKHGSCSGLEPDAYLELMREARQRVTIPPALRRLDRYTVVSPDAVEKAFVAANPGLPPRGIAVTCDNRRLREVRICLDRDDLGFRPCPEVDRRACSKASVVMPPVR